MKRFLTVVLVLTMILAVSMAAMAANGTWKSYASMGTGSLVSGTQYAQYSTRIAGVQQPTATVAANWTIITSDVKARDYSTTVGTGTDAVWNINDNDANYQKTFVTPGSFDQSRGIVMAKIKVNSAGSVGGTFGFSTANGYGLQLALRNGAIRVKTGEGGNALSPDPADIVTTQYRVYALSWVGNVANIWYSNGTDWNGDVSSWTKIADNYVMAGSTATQYNGLSLNGIVLFDSGGSNTWNGDIAWMAHNTYDNTAGEMNPWDFNPALASVPEPGSLLALASGLFGLVGFVTRRKSA